MSKIQKKFSVLLDAGRVTPVLEGATSPASGLADSSKASEPEGLAPRESEATDSGKTSKKSASRDGDSGKTREESASRVDGQAKGSGKTSEGSAAPSHVAGESRTKTSHASHIQTPRPLPHVQPNVNAGQPKNTHRDANKLPYVHSSLAVGRHFDKAVILIMGTTGHGKSKTINRLVGHNLLEVGNNTSGSTTKVFLLS